MGLNTTSNKTYKDYSHKNAMDGDSYDVSNPVYNLRLAASSCFFGEPKYYQKKTGSGGGYGSDELAKHLSLELGSTYINLVRKSWSMSPQEVMEDAIDAALDYSVEETLKEAVRLRNEDNIRATPQVILVRAANHPNSKGTGLIRSYARHIVKRADEPASCVSYQFATYGKKLPASLKRALADILTTYDDYTLAKYKMESRDVKTVDVVNLVHPKSTPSISKLVRGQLPNTKTWEAMRSAGASWEQIVSSGAMGHMALLRNLRNLKDVEPSIYLDKLKSGVAYGKQLPFRYYSAYKACEGEVQPQVLDAIEECLELSIMNVPEFQGKTMSLCDNSGSARDATTSSLGTIGVYEIANITAAMTAKCSENGHVGVFGDRLSTFQVRKKTSIFDATEKANSLGSKVGQRTEHGIWTFWRDAIRNKQHWDTVFVYSDMQAGHSGYRHVGLFGDQCGYDGYGCPMDDRFIDVPKLINHYRNAVNKDVNVFLVQVAGYEDTIVPEFFDKTYILGGWGEGILRFANTMIQNNKLIQ